MKNFWNWFRENHHTIKNLLNHSAENQETICYWINQNLKYYCRKIDSKETTEKRINKLENPFIIQDINLKEEKLKFIPISLEEYGKKTYNSHPS
jgi:hypothetical protein